MPGGPPRHTWTGAPRYPIIPKHPGSPAIPDPALPIYYDGNCRICQAQRKRFARLDRDRGRIRQVDFRDPGFDPGELQVSREALASGIHARTPDGRVVRGMAAIREAYRAVGKGWLVAPTGWPVLRPAFDFLYRVLARHRYRIGGRCEDGACKLPE